MKIIPFLMTLFCLIACEKQWPVSETDLTNLPAQQWHSLPLGSETKAANGSDYKMLIKKGESENLIIFFGGGGVTWDDASATRPINLWNFIRYGMEGMGFYFNSVSEASLSLKGLLDSKKKTNPFLDWSVTYIPYATGDFHIGNQTKVYKNKKGKNVTVHHNGEVNVTSSLAWIYKAFPNPKKVFVIGASAGAFGSTFWLQKIAAHYQDSKIYHLADGGYLYSPKWPNVVKNNWGANPNFSPSAHLIEDSMRSNLSRLNNVTILQSHTATDGTLIHFQAEINDRGSDSIEEKRKTWRTGAMSSMKRLASESSSYHYYVSNEGEDKNGSTAHTLSSFELFYTIGGYESWITSAVLDDNAYSVGEEFVD